MENIGFYKNLGGLRNVKTENVREDTNETGIHPLIIYAKDGNHFLSHFRVFSVIFTCENDSIFYVVHAKEGIHGFFPGHLFWIPDQARNDRYSDTGFKHVVRALTSFKKTCLYR